MDTQHKEIIRWYGRTAVAAFMVMNVLMVLTLIGSAISVYKVLNGELYSDSGVWGFILFAIMAFVLLSTGILLEEAYLKRITYKGAVITQVEGLFWRHTTSIDLSRVTAVSTTAGRMLLFSPNNLFGLKLTDDTGKEFWAPIWSYGGTLLAALAGPLRTIMLNPKVTVANSGVGIYKALHWYYKNVPANFDTIITDPNRSLASAPDAWVPSFTARHNKLVGLAVLAFIIIVAVGGTLLLKMWLQP